MNDTKINVRYLNEYDKFGVVRAHKAICGMPIVWAKQITRTKQILGHAQEQWRRFIQSINNKKSKCLLTNKHRQLCIELIAFHWFNFAMEIISPFICCRSFTANALAEGKHTAYFHSSCGHSAALHRIAAAPKTYPKIDRALQHLTINILNVKSLGYLYHAINVIICLEIRCVLRHILCASHTHKMAIYEHFPPLIQTVYIVYRPIFPLIWNRNHHSNETAT